MVVELSLACLRSGHRAARWCGVGDRYYACRWFGRMNHFPKDEQYFQGKSALNTELIADHRSQSHDVHLAEVDLAIL